MKILKFIGKILLFIYHCLIFYVRIIHFIVWNRQMNKAEKSGDYKLIVQVDNRGFNNYIKFESYPILIAYLFPWLSLYYMYIDQEFLTIKVISGIIILYSILRSFEHINPKIIN